MSDLHTLTHTQKIHQDNCLLVILYSSEAANECPKFLAYKFATM